jgi:hypothetical protein
VVWVKAALSIQSRTAMVWLGELSGTACDPSFRAVTASCRHSAVRLSAYREGKTHSNYVDGDVAHREAQHTRRGKTAGTSSYHTPPSVNGVPRVIESQHLDTDAAIFIVCFISAPADRLNNQPTNQLTF